MHRSLRGYLIAFWFLGLSSVSVAAGTALGINAGTRGVVLDFSYGLTHTVSLRGTFGGLDYGKDVTEGGVRYDGDLNLRGGGLLIDWHPAAGAMRFSAGGLYNGNKLKARAVPANGSTITIGNNTYNVAGESVDGNIDWDNFAPYLGIGFGNRHRKPGWGFGLDLGVMYTRKPSATLTASPGLQALPGFNADLALEQDELNREIEDAKFWPVLQLGVHYRF